MRRGCAGKGKPGAGDRLGGWRMEDGEGGTKYLGCFVNWILPSTPTPRSPSTSKSAAAKSALNPHSAISIFPPKARLSKWNLFVVFLFSFARLIKIYLLCCSYANRTCYSQRSCSEVVGSWPLIHPAKHTAKRVITLHSHFSRLWQAPLGWQILEMGCEAARKTVFGCVAFPG
jgi:hypothetical protein